METRSISGLSPKAEFEITDTHLEFLDDLRKSGETNMFGGASYVQQRFSLSKKDAAAVLMHWMATFEARQKP